ncbi:MAG: hypothetical protein ACLPXT_12585 [Terracidiphilus sp.]
MAILFTFVAVTRAQVAPAAMGPTRLPTGPTGLPVSGTLRYDLRYSQTAQFYGGTQGNGQTSGVTGDLTYANTKAARPFALTYSGGDNWTISGAGGGSGIYQHLLASQGFIAHSWSFNINDNVSYTPQAPTTGFSGIPGAGGLPGVPGAPAQLILTLDTRSVNNMTGTTYTHLLDHSTSFGISGSYGILRFPDGNGLETNSLQVGPQISRRLNALSSISAQYAFSHFSYPGFPISMGTQSAMFGYTRSWSRRFNTSAAAGPEWIQGSAGSDIPSSTDLTANANATYGAKSIMATLGFSHATSGGAGITSQVGVHSDNVNAALSRQQGKNLSISFTGAYMRTQGLQQQQTGVTNGAGVTNAKYGGVSATQRWGRYIIAFANYTAIQQSSSSAIVTSNSNAVSGLSQVIGFGIGYSPREIHLRK